MKAYDEENGMLAEDWETSEALRSIEEKFGDSGAPDAIDLDDAAESFWQGGDV